MQATFVIFFNLCTDADAYDCLRDESMRDLGKSIDYLLIFVSEWMSGDWYAHFILCVCVCVCVCVTWLLFDR